MITIRVPTRHAVSRLLSRSLLLAVGLVACQGLPLPGPLAALPAAIHADPAIAPVQLATPTSSVSASLTALPVPSATSTPQVQLPTTPPATATPDALPLALPEETVQAGADWRPPLYEAPWAPGLNDHFYFIRPIGADQPGGLLNSYRYGGVDDVNAEVVHTGIDITAANGTAVLAAGPGKVVWASYGLFFNNHSPNDPYGLAVAIRHDFGYQGRRLYTVYAHLSKVDVRSGQSVNAGEKIGEVGETGNTTGPHLHFEVRVDENNFFATRNPELWLAPPQGWGVLVGRMLDYRSIPLGSELVIVTSYDTERVWKVRTYAHSAVNPDDAYRENFVLSDLPAGRYQIKVQQHGHWYAADFEIHPGQVTPFNFHGPGRFRFEAPSAPAFEPVFVEP